MLRFDAVTIDPQYEPPRPVVMPRRRIVAVRRGTIDGCQADYREDWGLATTRQVRFVSSETQGFLTAAQVAALIALYEAGQAFQLETDLLAPLGSAPVTYAAAFSPDVEPVFTPATPGGELYYFDVVVDI